MGGNKSKPPPSPTFSRAWRQIDWRESRRNEMMEKLKSFELNDTNFNLRVLLYGPIGAGKSSFITSLSSIFLGRMAHKAEAASNEGGASCTKKYKSHTIKSGKGNLPFVFNDVMGLERTVGGTVGGMHHEDVVSALKGHIQENYEFKPDPIKPGMPAHREKPSLGDKAHCLVSVVDADKINVMDANTIDKMKKIREVATDLEIPQIVLMTKSDTVCELVAKDLKSVYTSKAMKQKMETCSNRLGVPMNCILPVVNYHAGGDLDGEQDVLLLAAMTQIVNFANDYVWNIQQCEGNE